ncbi:Genetic suppressor element 1 [Rhodotorula kratochvilovae]
MAASLESRKEAAYKLEPIHNLLSFHPYRQSLLAPPPPYFEDGYCAGERDAACPSSGTASSADTRSPAAGDHGRAHTITSLADGTNLFNLIKESFLHHVKDGGTWYTPSTPLTPDAVALVEGSSEADVLAYISRNVLRRAGAFAQGLIDKVFLVGSPLLSKEAGPPNVGITVRGEQLPAVTVVVQRAGAAPHEVLRTIEANAKSNHSFRMARLRPASSPPSDATERVAGGIVEDRCAERRADEGPEDVATRARDGAAARGGSRGTEIDGTDAGGQSSDNARGQRDRHGAASSRTRAPRLQDFEAFGFGGHPVHPTALEPDDRHAVLLLQRLANEIGVHRELATASDKQPLAFLLLTPHEGLVMLAIGSVLLVSPMLELSAITEMVAALLVHLIPSPHFDATVDQLPSRQRRALFDEHLGLAAHRSGTVSASTPSSPPPAAPSTLALLSSPTACTPATPFSTLSESASPSDGADTTPTNSPRQITTAETDADAQVGATVSTSLDVATASMLQLEHGAETLLLQRMDGLKPQGAKIAHLTIAAPLGAGKSSQVYTDSTDTFAIKVVSCVDCEDDEDEHSLLADVEQEVDALVALLDVDWRPRFYGAFEDAYRGVIVLVMEKLPGHACSSWAQISDSHAVGAFRALSTLHHAGLAHGDFHPGNFIASTDGSISLVDLGSSMWTTRDADQEYEKRRLVRYLFPGDDEEGTRCRIEELKAAL